MQVSGHIIETCELWTLKGMAAAGSGGGAAFAAAGAALASVNGGVASASVWVVDQDEFDAHPFTVCAHCS